MTKIKNVLYLAISNVLFFLLVVLLVVFLVEGVFRAVGMPYKVKYIPNENSFAQFDPVTGWSYIPNKSSNHKAGQSVNHVHFEENGIRVPNPDFKFDYSKPSVLFIGGSFTMGHGLSFEESLAGQFGDLKEVPYQVVNLGVQGYGTDQTLLTLKKHISKFKTKVVVYTFIEDHILRNGNYDRRMLIPTARFLGTKPQFALDSNNKLYLARKALLYKDYTNSYLYDFFKVRVGGLLGQFPPYPTKLTKAIIKEMKRFSNEHDAHFVVINWRWSMNDYDELGDLVDINIIDTMETAPDNWEKMVISPGTHPNAEANEHVTQTLLDYFYSKGLL